MPKVTITYDLDTYDESDHGFDEERKLKRALQSENLIFALDEFTNALRRVTKNGLMADGIPYHIYIDSLDTIGDPLVGHLKTISKEEYDKLLVQDVDGDMVVDCIRNLYYEILKENNINLED